MPANSEGINLKNLRPDWFQIQNKISQSMKHTEFHSPIIYFQSEIFHHFSSNTFDKSNKTNVSGIRIRYSQELEYILMSFR